MKYLKRVFMFLLVGLIGLTAFACQKGVKLILEPKENLTCNVANPKDGQKVEITINSPEGKELDYIVVDMNGVEVDFTQDVVENKLTILARNNAKIKAFFKDKVNPGPNPNPNPEAKTFSIEKIEKVDLYGAVENDAKVELIGISDQTKVGIDEEVKLKITIPKGKVIHRVDVIETYEEGDPYEKEIPDPKAITTYKVDEKVKKKIKSISFRVKFKDPNDTDTIIFWHAMSKANKAALEEQIKEFTAKTNIKVVTESKGGYNELRNYILTAIPAGNEPHLAMCYNDHVAAYNATQEKVLNLKPFIEDPNIGIKDVDDFVEGFYDEGSAYIKSNVIYNLPFAKSTEVLYYNKTEFDKRAWEAPKTWEEFDELADKILNDATLKPKFENKEMAAVLGYDSSANWMITLAEQYGLGYTKVENEEGKVLFGDDAVIEAWIPYMSKMREQFQAKKITTKAQLGGSYTSTKFCEGKILMTIGSSGGTKYNIPDDEHKFEIGVAPIPNKDVLSANRVIQQGPNLCIFDKKNDQINKKTFELLKFLTSSEISAEYSAKTGYAPVRKSSYDQQVMKDLFAKNITEDNKNARTEKTIIEILKLTQKLSNQNAFFTSPAFDKSSVARDKIESVLSSVLTGKIDGTETPEKVKELIKKAFKEAYQAVILG